MRTHKHTPTNVLLHITYARYAVRSSRAENVPAVPVAETLFSHCRALGFGLWFELDPTAAAELRDPRAATENEDPTAAAQSRRSQINAYFEREAAEVDSAPGSPTLRPEPLPPLRSSEAAATRARPVAPSHPCYVRALPSHSGGRGADRRAETLHLCFPPPVSTGGSFAPRGHLAVTLKVPHR